MFKSPQFTRPELVQIGDDISVEFMPNDGVAMTLRGVVASREDHGNVRYMKSAEGGTILAWTPGVDNKLRVLIHGRIDNDKHDTLFDLLDTLHDVRERVA